MATGEFAGRGNGADRKGSWGGADVEGGGGAQQQSVDSQPGCCVGWEGWSASVAVATVGVGRHRRGRRARVRGRRKLTEGVWWTALHHFAWLESAGGWAVACGIFGLVGQLASRAGQGTAEIDRGGVVECPSPLCLHFPP